MTQSRTSPLKIAISWAIVGLPLAWGVYQTVLKSLPLFAGHWRPHGSACQPGGTGALARSLSMTSNRLPPPSRGTHTAEPSYVRAIRLTR